MDHCGANPTAGSQTQASQDRATHHRPIRQDICGHAPRIIQAIADGAAPSGLTVSRLTQALPHSWQLKNNCSVFADASSPNPPDKHWKPDGDRPHDGRTLLGPSNHKVAVVTGGPGVGKTTLLDAILRILVPKGTKLLLAAPTGRAAKRMTEHTRIEAKTIHRLLETDLKDGGFKRNAEHPLECDLLVIDETSMVDASLMFAVMKAIPPKAGLLLVGDVDQLPSVGPGQVLSDIIKSGAIPVTRLTEVFRQAAESRIVVTAHRINQGEMPEWPKRGDNSDVFFVEVTDPEDGRPRWSRSSVTAFLGVSVSILSETCRSYVRCNGEPSALARSMVISRRPSIRTWRRKSSVSARPSLPATK